MAGMLLFFMMALYAELSVLKPFQDIGNSADNIAHVCELLLSSQERGIDKAQIWTSGPKFHSSKRLSKFACVDGLECREQNEMELLLHEKDSSKILSCSAQSIKLLAQIDFCSYLPHAASCTKITMTNTIEIGRVLIRHMQTFVRATRSYRACCCKLLIFLKACPD